MPMVCGSGKHAVRVVFPHLDQAAEIVPAADIGAQQAAAEGPGDGRQIAATIAFLVQNLDLERAGGHSDDAFHPRQQFLHDERFARRLHLGDVEINAGAGTLQRVVVIEHPENDHAQSGRGRVAIDRDVLVEHVDAGRANQARRPLLRRRD